MEKNEKDNATNEFCAEEEDILKRVNDLLDEEAFEAALLELNKIESLERNGDALHLRGVINYSLKQYESALEDLNRAEKLNPKERDILMQTVLFRARVYLGLNMMREAYVDMSLWNENTVGGFQWREEKDRVEQELLKGHPTKEFNVIQLIDEGAYGKVHLATWNGKHVALKTPLKISREAIVKEALTSMKFRHENVVSALGLYNRDSDEVSFIMEYAEAGSLYNLLYKQKVKLSRQEIVDLARDVASGLAYLHERSTIHRDLKSANILLFEQKSRAKIADFGQSRFLNEKSVAKTVTGTFGFIAPEVLAEQDYDEKADVYSFGALLYEMCTNKALPIIGIEEDRMQIICANVEEKEFREIIMDCCKTDPKQRPTSQECLDRITTILENTHKQQRLDAVRKEFHTKFMELLRLWKDLNTTLKQLTVTMFLSLKYDIPDPTDDGESIFQIPRSINTDELIPVDFAFREEFINIAKDIVAAYPTDEEKMRQFEFAPPDIYERVVPAAKILLEANMSDIDRVNVLMIGDNGIGKSCLGNSFCRPPRNLQLKEGNCTGVAMTTSIERVQYTFNGRSVCFIDTPGFYNTAKADKNQSLQFHDLRSYISFVINQVACNAPHVKGEKIHIVLFCLQKPRIEDWQLSVINAIAEFAQVMVVQLQCSSEENLKTDLKDYDIASFHAVLAKDKTIKGRTTPAHGMHDLARAMARELLNWKKKNDELSELFYSNQEAYYGVLRKKGFAIVSAITARLYYTLFADLGLSVHVGMFGAIIRLYGMTSSVGTLETIAQRLRVSTAENLSVAAEQFASIWLKILLPPVFSTPRMDAASRSAVTGVSFLNIIHNKALKGDFSEITEHNQHLILEEMKAEEIKINTTKEK